MNKIDGKPYVFDVMKEIAKERKRLEKIVASPEYEKRKHQWGWMEEWLEKTDEEHFDHNYKTDSCYTGYIDDKYCNVCSKCLDEMNEILRNKTE